MLRRLPAVVVTVVGGAVAAAAVLAVPAAADPVAAAPAATPVFVAGPGEAVLGDLTADGRRDRTTLGRLGSSGACAVQLAPGVAGGGYSATAATIVVPIRRVAASAGSCPDRAVVLTGPTASQNRLAVTFSTGAGSASPAVQVFTVTAGVAVYSVGVAGQDQPGRIGSRDFDGDGYGDVWESTDQGEGFGAYLVRALSSRVLYRSPTTAVATARFLDLDHRPGVDIVLTTDAYPAYHASAVAIDGRTGATQVLAASEDGAVLDYRVAAVDRDGDGYPDLRVTSVPDPWSGPAPVDQTFLNRSQGSAFAFVATNG